MHAIDRKIYLTVFSGRRKAARVLFAGSRRRVGRNSPVASLIRPSRESLNAEMYRCEQPFRDVHVEPGERKTFGEPSHAS